MISFEQTQLDVAELKRGQSIILSLLQTKVKPQHEIEAPLNIKEVSKLIKKTVPTIYGYCQHNEIPFSKKGNRLYFFKSKIIDWLKQSEIKTLSEIEAETDVLLSKQKKGLK
jgi:predicted DNA-binding transcriptional regulator AlpA